MTKSTAGVVYKELFKGKTVSSGDLWNSEYFYLL